MNGKLVFRLTGLLILLEAVCMLVPALVSMLYRESDWVWFLLSAVITGAAGGGMVFLCRNAQRGIHAREGFALTGFSWLLLSLFGTLPALLSGAIPSFYDALFESISGFTTTGATVLFDVEGFTHGHLFWRALTHWIGGMGVLILFLALLPSLGERSIQLLRAESPGPTPSKLVPRISGTAKILYTIYTVMTAIAVLAFRLAGMPLFDSVVHALSTAGTGGFSIKNASIGAYDAPLVQVTVAVFMLLFGVSFAVYFHLLRRKASDIKANTELWVYLGFIGAATLLITTNIARGYLVQGSSVLSAAKDSFFSVTAIITSTGFATADYGVWPEFSHVILLILMVTGGCAGSTSGGVKMIRFVIIFKSITAEIKKIVHPRAVSLIKVGGRVVDERVVASTLQFFSVYVLLLLLGTLFISLEGLGLVTSFSAMVAALSNIGPGLGAIGPSGNYAVFSNGGKCFLAFCMLIGRLEIFPVLMLLSPMTWRKN